jgi:uncharacterized protein YqgQ
MQMDIGGVLRQSQLFEADVISRKHRMWEKTNYLQADAILARAQVN